MLLMQLIQEKNTYSTKRVNFFLNVFMDNTTEAQQVQRSPLLHNGKLARLQPQSK